MILWRDWGLREKGQEGNFGDTADFRGCLHFMIRKVGEMIDSFIYFPKSFTSSCNADKLIIFVKHTDSLIILWPEVNGLGSDCDWPCLLPMTCPSCWLEVSASIAHTVAASPREMDSELGAWLLFLRLCDFLMFLEPFVCLVWPLT